MENDKSMPNDPALIEPQWYLLVDGRELGPFNLAQIKRFADKDMLTRESSLRDAGSGSLVPANGIPGLFERPSNSQESSTQGAPVFREQRVAFQTFAAGTDPLRLGKGSVRIAEDMLILYGRRRRLFALRKAEERIPLKDIHDVAVTGRIVRFRAEGQKARQPRLLQLPDKETAQQLAACLPDRLTPQAAQAQADEQAFQRILKEGPAPRVTLALIALNIAVYLYAGMAGAGWWSGNAEALLKLGGNFAAATAQGEWWRLLSAMFLHAGIIHLAFNMWALWDGGRIAERLFGSSNYAFIYLLSGLMGGIASINWQQSNVGVGASGAVFGIYGALFIALALRKDLLPQTVSKRMMTFMAIFMTYSLINGAKAGIDNAAHFGGLFAGLLLGAGFIASTARKWVVTAAAGILLAVGSARAVDAAQPVRDEMAFRAFIVAYAADENRINQAAQTLLVSVRTLPPQEFVQRIGREVVAGWQEQHKRISALTNLTSHNQQLRDYMLRFVKLKQQGFEAMRDGVRHDDKQLVLSSKEKFDQANGVLEEMKQWVEAQKK